MIKHSSIYFLIGLSLIGKVSSAQDANKSALPAISKITKSELKENGYWGIYEDLPYLKAQKSDIWLNSDTKTLELALLKIKAQNKFLPLLHLSQSLVFSGGLPPAKAYPKLSEARFLAAIEIGEIKTANRLAANYDLEKAGEDFANKYIDNLFYESKNEDACALIDATKPEKPNKKFLEMRAGCYALNNEKSAALLNIDIANQIGASPNIWMNNAIIYLSSLKSGGAPAVSLDFNSDSGMAYAISNAANLKPKAEGFSHFYYKTANAIKLSNEKLGFDASIAAANFGAIDADSIEHINPPPPINPVEGESPIEPSFEETMAFNLKKAVEITDFYAIANSYKSEFQNARIVSIDDAPLFGAAALLASDLVAAQKFVNLNEAINPSLKFALDIAKNPKTLDAKSRLMGLDTGSKDYFKAIGELIIASKLGIEIENFSPIEAILPSSGDGVAQILMAMEDAANEKARAQTALLAHLATQNLRPTTIDPISLSRIVGALNSVGFKSEARELAIYCLISQNISFTQPKPPPVIAPPTKPKTPEVSKPKPSEKAPITKPKTQAPEAKKPDASKAAPKIETPKSVSKPVVKSDSKPTPVAKSKPKTEPKPKSDVPDWGKPID